MAWLSTEAILTFSDEFSVLGIKEKRYTSLRNAFGRRRASCRIRTNDPEITNHVLWPTELKRRVGKLLTSHRYDQVPLLCSHPGGFRGSWSCKTYPFSVSDCKGTHIFPKSKRRNMKSLLVLRYFKKNTLLYIAYVREILYLCNVFQKK